MDELSYLNDVASKSLGRFDLPRHQAMSVRLAGAVVLALSIVVQGLRTTKATKNTKTTFVIFVSFVVHDVVKPVLLHGHSDRSRGAEPVRRCAETEADIIAALANRF